MTFALQLCVSIAHMAASGVYALKTLIFFLDSAPFLCLHCVSITLLEQHLVRLANPVTTH